MLFLYKTIVERTNNLMEIERKFTLTELPPDLESFPHHEIEQAYLNIEPVIRIRRQDEKYFLTYKGSGMMAREEYKKQLLILDELLDKLDKHDKSVFNKNFDYEDEDIENYLDDDVFTVPRSKKNKGKIDKLIELNGDEDE